jgi:hypothetical protein
LTYNYRDTTGKTTTDREQIRITGDTGPQGPQGLKGDKGEKGEKGDRFSISKVYNSIDELKQKIAEVPEGEFVILSTENVNDPDNARLYVSKGKGSYEYITDLSGATGIQGPKGEPGKEGPQGPKGDKGDLDEEQLLQLKQNTNKIRAVENVLYGKGFIAKESNEMTEYCREIGGPSLADDILDGSYMTVNKIKGNSKQKSLNLIDFDSIVNGTTVKRDEFNNYVIDMGNQNITPIIYTKESLWSPGTVPGIFYVLIGEIKKGYQFSGKPSVGIKRLGAMLEPVENHYVGLDIDSRETYTGSGFYKFYTTFYPKQSFITGLFFGLNQGTMRNVALYRIGDDGELVDDRYVALEIAKEIKYTPFFNTIKHSQLYGIKTINNLVNSERLLNDFVSKTEAGYYKLFRNGESHQRFSKKVSGFFPKGKVTISMKVVDTNLDLTSDFKDTSLTWRIAQKDGVEKANFIKLAKDGIISSTLTLVEDGKFLDLYFQGIPYSEDGYIIVKDIMVNCGETPMEYTPYEENIMPLVPMITNFDGLVRENCVKNSYNNYTITKISYPQNASGYRDATKSMAVNLPKGTYSFLIKQSKAGVVPLTIHIELKDGTFKDYDITSGVVLVRKFESDLIAIQIGINSSSIDTPAIGTSVNIYDLEIKSARPLELGAHDYFENGAIVEQTNKSNGHILTEPTYKVLDVNTEILAKKGGIEQVITPKDENGHTCFDCGANTTEKLTYITVLGGD